MLWLQILCEALCMNFLMKISQLPCEAKPLVPSVHMKKPRLTEVMHLALGHTVDK